MRQSRGRRAAKMKGVDDGLTTGDPSTTSLQPSQGLCFQAARIGDDNCITPALDRPQQQPAKRALTADIQSMSNVPPSDIPSLQSLAPPPDGVDAYARPTAPGHLRDILHIGSTYSLNLAVHPGYTMPLKIEALLAHESYSLLYRVSTVNPAGACFVLRILLSSEDLDLQEHEALLHDFQMSGACAEEATMLQNMEAACGQSSDSTMLHARGKILTRHALLLSHSQASLRQLVSTCQGLPEHLTKDITLQLLQTLTACHTAGLHHRNLCLGSVLLRETGSSSSTSSSQPSGGSAGSISSQASICSRVTTPDASGRYITPAPAHDVLMPDSDPFNSDASAAAAAATSSTSQAAAPGSSVDGVDAGTSPSLHASLIGFCPNVCFQGPNGCNRITRVAPYSRHAPEVDDAKPYGPEADTYALGMLMLEMLTGVDPFAYLLDLACVATQQEYDQIMLRGAACGCSCCATATYPLQYCVAEAHDMYCNTSSVAAEYLMYKQQACELLLDCRSSPFSSIPKSVKHVVRGMLAVNPSDRTRLQLLRQHPYFTLPLPSEPVLPMPKRSRLSR